MSPRRARGMLAMGLASLALLAGGRASADTLEFTDGTVLNGCFVRDEGIRYLGRRARRRSGACRPPLRGRRSKACQNSE